MEELQLNETIEKIKKESNELLQSANISELIKNNVIEFDYLDRKYRIKKPTFEQKQKTNQERMKKFIMMLKDPTFIMEADLIKLYESRGISIKELDDNFNVLKKQREDYALKLGKALEDRVATEELEIFRKEIETIIASQSEIVMRKSILLDSSLESQINIFVYTYMAYMITEIYIKGKDLGEGNKEPDLGWQKAWANYDDFLKEDEELVNKTVWYSTLITRNEVNPS